MKCLFKSLAHFLLIRLFSFFLIKLQAFVFCFFFFLHKSFYSDVIFFFFFSICGLFLPCFSFQETLLVLMKSNSSVSPFMDDAFVSISKNSFVTKVTKIFSYVFPSKKRCFRDLLLLSDLRPALCLPLVSAVSVFLFDSLLPYLPVLILHTFWPDYVRCLFWGLLCQSYPISS